MGMSWKITKLNGAVARRQIARDVLIIPTAQNTQAIPITGNHRNRRSARNARSVLRSDQVEGVRE